MLTQETIIALLKEHLAEFEPERKAIDKAMNSYKNKFWSSIVFSIGAFAFIVAYTNAEGYAVLFLLVWAIGLYFLYLKPSSKSKPSPHLEYDFGQRVRGKVFLDVLKVWNSSVSYSPQHYIARRLGLQTFLKEAISSKNSEYTGANHIKGQLEDGRSFQFSEILVKEWAQMNTNSGQKVQGQRVAFMGILIVLENSIPFEGFDGELSIFPTDAAFRESPTSAQEEESLSMKLLQAQQQQQDILDADFIATTKVSMPTQPSTQETFAQEYIIQGNPTDVEALPEHFQQLVEWKYLLDTPVNVQFVNQKAFVLVKQPSDFWHISTKQPLLNKPALEQLSQELYAVLALIEKLAALTVKK